MMDRGRRNGKLNLLICTIRFFYWHSGVKHVYNSKSPVALPGAVSAPSPVALPPRTDASAAPVTALRHCCARLNIPEKSWWEKAGRMNKISFSYKLSRLGTRLKDRDWRRYGAL